MLIVVVILIIIGIIGIASTKRFIEIRSAGWDKDGILSENKIGGKESCKINDIT